MGKTVPEWVFSPTNKILSVVVTWIVAGFVTAGNSLTNSIAAVFAAISQSFAAAGASVFLAGTTLEKAVFSVFRELNAVIVTVATSAGPLAPLVTIGLSAGVVLLALVAAGTVYSVLKTVVLWVT